MSDQNEVLILLRDRNHHWTIGRMESTEKRSDLMNAIHENRLEQWTGMLIAPSSRLEDVDKMARKLNTLYGGEHTVTPFDDLPLDQQERALNGSPGISC